MDPQHLDLDTMEAGEKRLCLVAHNDYDGATIHLVVQVSGSLFVAFYSTGTAMRAAVSKDARELVAWVLYDSLAENTAGLNGWALVCIGKAARTVSLVRKHPANPLALLLPGHLAARTGGNLCSDVRVAGRRALFYLSKPDAVTYRFAVALSDDPLFGAIAENIEFDGVLGREQVVEKFEAFLWKGLLHLVYEVGPRGERLWRTGLRRYRLAR